MSEYRKLTQKFCIAVVFWLNEEEFSDDELKQTEAIRLFISKYLNQLRRTHCLRTDLERLVSRIGSSNVQDWFDLYKSAGATEIDLIPVLISVAYDTVSEDARQKMVKVISSKIEGAELSSQVSTEDIVLIFGSLFGKHNPKLYLAPNDQLETSVDRSRRMSLSEQILNISGGASILDSPSRRAPCSRCTDLEQKLLFKAQCVRNAERENEDLLQFREDAKKINADLQEKIEKQNRQLQKISDYESVQNENIRLLAENTRLEEATAKLSRVLTENEVLRLRISQYIDKLENKEVDMSKLEATIYERTEAINCKDSEYCNLESQLEELKEAFYQERAENMELKRVLEENSSTQGQDASEIEQKSFETPSFSASLPLQQSTNEEESIQLQFLRKDLQEKEEELKVTQQKLSDLSRKVLDLESAEYLAKQKDDLIEKLEDTKKELNERNAKLLQESKEQQLIASQSNNALSSRIDELHAELSDRLKSLKALERELQLTKSTVDMLSDEKNALIESLEVQKQESIVSLPGLENMDESWKSERADNEAFIEALRAELQVAKENLEVKLDELDEHRAILQEKTKTIDSFREMRDDLVEKLEKKEEVIRNKDEELEGLRNKLDFSEKERDDILHTSKETSNELDDARKSINEMREMRDSLVSEVSKNRLVIETMRKREEELVADNQKCEAAIRELQEEIRTEKKVSHQRGLKMELMRVEEEQSISLLKKSHEEIYSKRSAELDEKNLELDAARNSISAMKKEYEASVKQSEEAFSLLTSEHKAKIKTLETELESVRVSLESKRQAQKDSHEEEISDLKKQTEEQETLLQERKKTIDGFREMRNELVERLKKTEEVIRHQERELVDETKKREIVTNKYSAAKVKIQELEEAIASKNQVASKTTDKLVNDLRRELALKNRELVEKTNEETQAREKIEKLINDKERLKKTSDEVSKENEELQATVKSLERSKLMDSETLELQKREINDLQNRQRQTDVEEEFDELDTSNLDRSRMSQLPLPSQSTLSEAALRKHNAENQLFSTPIQTPGFVCDDEDDDDHARQALFRTSRLRTVIGKDEDKTSSSTANKTTSDPASSLSSKSSPESRTSLESKTADKENEFQYTTRGDFKSRRNELQPPHLRSSYPVEQESTPSKEAKLKRNAFKKPKRRSSMMEFGNTIRKRFKRTDKAD